MPFIMNARDLPRPLHASHEQKARGKRRARVSVRNHAFVLSPRARRAQLNTRRVSARSDASFMTLGASHGWSTLLGFATLRLTESPRAVRAAGDAVEPSARMIRHVGR